jgi:hypothetical protein
VTGDFCWKNIFQVLVLKGVLLRMAGPQHSFPSGFPSAQQGAMRNQFGGAPQIGGLMSSTQQTGISGCIIEGDYRLSNDAFLVF